MTLYGVSGSRSNTTCGHQDATVPVMAQLVVIGRWTATAVTHYYPVHPPSLYPLIMILYTKPLPTKPLPTKEVLLSTCTSSMTLQTWSLNYHAAMDTMNRVA